MALSGAIAGRAFWSIGLNDADFKNGLRQAQLAVNSFAAGIAGLGAIGALRLGVGIFKPFLDEAAEAQRVMFKFQTVFGAGAPAMKKWADDFADSMNRSRIETAKFASETEATLFGLGLSGAQVDPLVKGLTRLGVDLAAFSQTSDAEAFTALASALAGENEALKKYRITVTESTVDSTLMAEGMRNVTNTATVQEKALSRVIFLMSNTAQQQGYAAKSAFTMVQAWKALEGATKELYGALGAVAVDVFGPLAQNLADMAKGAAVWARANGELVGSITKWVIGIGAAFTGVILLGAGVQLVAFSLAGLAILFGGIASAAVSVGTAIGGVAAGAFGVLVTPVGAAVAAIVVLAAAFFDIEKAATGVRGELFKLIKVFTDTFTSFASTWKGIVAAVATGDLSDAFKILWSGMSLSMNEALVGMYKALYAFSAQVYDLFAHIGEAVSNTLKSPFRSDQENADTVKRQAEEQKTRDAQVKAGLAGIDAAQLGPQRAAHKALVDAAILKREQKRQADASKSDFDKAKQAAKDLLGRGAGRPDVSGGTFIGPLASRIIGGSDPQKRMIQLLQNIDRNMADVAGKKGLAWVP